jgi:hypothetical protein
LAAIRLLQPDILAYNCARGEIVMRTAILTFAFVMGMAAALAMPLIPSAGSSNVVLVHGCHHYYAQDLSGWHRHDKNCNTLRGTVKNRNSEKS